MSEQRVSQSAKQAAAVITTYVQVHTDTFREVVQRLTGPSSTNDENNKRAAPRLHERRQYDYSRPEPKLDIVKPPAANCNFHSQPLIDPRRQSSLSSPGRSPSIGTPCAVLSKLSIVEQQEDHNSKDCFHAGPELLSLFPLTSPRTNLFSSSTP